MTKIQKKEQITQEFNFNCYMLSQLLYLFDSCVLPPRFQKRVQTLAIEMDEYCLPIPFKYKNWDMVKEKFECTTYYEEFIPKAKRDE